MCRGQGSIFFRDPDLRGLPGWETHKMSIKEGVKKYAGRREPEGPPKYHTTENPHWREVGRD